MANKKITELDAATSLASTDVLVAVDVSEDVTKQVTTTNLFRTLPDGTAAAPALAFSSDAANGVYLAGTDTVGISTGGTQRVTVDGSGNVTISGGLTVEGQTTTVESTIVTIDDKNIELGSVASPSNTTADGGGITLKGATDKTIKWINSTGYWTFNTGIEVGGHLQIDDLNEIRVGSGNDLNISHDATNSIINSSTGYLKLTANSGAVYLQSDSDVYITSHNAGETMARFTKDGAVELYHDNSKKFETKSDGIDVTGEVQCDSLDVDGAADITGNVTLHANLDLQDNDRLNIGSSDDFTIRHNGTDTHIENDTGTLFITQYQDDSDIAIRTDDSAGAATNYILCDGSEGNVRLYHYGTQKLGTKSDGIDVTGEVQCDSLDVDGALDIDGGQIYYDAANNNLHFIDNVRARFGTGSDLRIYHDGSNSYIDDAGTGVLNIRSNDLRLGKYTGELGLQIIADGETRLHYDNSVKLATKTGGVDVTGELECDSLDVDGNIDIHATRISYSTSNEALKFLDNIKSVYGNGDDLQIYHDGNHSYIKDAGTGELRILGNVCKFNNATNTATLLRATESGSVDLFYNGAQKLATKSDGVDVTGEVQCDSLDVDGAADITGNVTLHGNLDLQDNDLLRLGTGDDLQIYHDGSNSIIKNSTGHLKLRANTVHLNNNADNESMALFTANGAVELFYDNSKKFETKSDGIDVIGEVQCDSLDVDGVVNIGAANTSDAQLEIGAGATGNRNAYVDLIGDTTYTDYGLRVQRDNGGANGASKILHRGTGDFRFVAQEAATIEFFTSNVERLRLDSSGRLLLGTTTEGDTTADNLTIADSGNCGMTVRSGTSSSGSIFFSDATSGSGEYDGYVQYQHDNRALRFATAATERLRINSNGAWGIEGASNYGTSGQILTSNGNDAPSWQDAGSVAVGGSSAISMNDNVNINFGNSNDLQIFHNGTNNEVVSNTGYLKVTGQNGDLYLQSNSDVWITSHNAGETMARFIKDGASELYFNNSRKFTTNSGGIDVTGESKCDTLNVDGTADIAGQLSVDRVVIRDNGSSSPLLAIRADDAGPWGMIIGNDSYSTNTNYGLAIYQGSNGDVAQQLKGNGAWENFYLQQSNGSTTNTAIHIDTNRAVILKYQNNTKLQTKSDGIDVTGEVQCDTLDVDGAADFTSEVRTHNAFRAHDTNGGIYMGDSTGGFGDSCAMARAQNAGYHASGSAVGDLVIGPDRQKSIVFGTTTSSSGALGGRCRVTSAGHFEPMSNNAHDLGSSSLRWRNVYTNDLNLSNEGSGNDVDGTWGNYTIQEGEDDLFLINRRNGKKYKFNLTEVS